MAELDLVLPDEDIKYYATRTSRASAKKNTWNEISDFFRNSDIPSQSDEFILAAVEEASEWRRYVEQDLDEIQIVYKEHDDKIVGNSNALTLYNDSSENTEIHTNNTPIKLDWNSDEKLWVMSGLHPKPTTSTRSQEKFQFTLPEGEGLRRLNSTEDFKLPWSIYCPTIDNERPLIKWKNNLRKNIWNVKNPFKNFTPREPECQCQGGFCDSDCFNRYEQRECFSYNCAYGDEDCGNRQFTNLEKDLKSGKSYAAGYEVVQTEKKGAGLVATRSYNENTLIVEYTGEIITLHEVEDRLETIYKNVSNFYFLGLEDDLIIDAGQKGSVARFANHSCDPNSEIQKWYANGEPRIGLFAKRNIEAGEEILYDYNFEYIEKADPPKCYCDAKNCRGFIGKKSEDAELKQSASDISDFEEYDEQTEPITNTKAANNKNQTPTKAIAQQSQSKTTTSSQKSLSKSPSKTLPRSPAKKPAKVSSAIESTKSSHTEVKNKTKDVPQPEKTDESDDSFVDPEIDEELKLKKRKRLRSKINLSDDEDVEDDSLPIPKNLVMNMAEPGSKLSSQTHKTQIPVSESKSSSPKKNLNTNGSKSTSLPAKRSKPNSYESKRQHAKESVAALKKISSSVQSRKKSKYPEKRTDFKPKNGSSATDTSFLFDGPDFASLKKSKRTRPPSSDAIQSYDDTTYEEENGQMVHVQHDEYRNQDPEYYPVQDDAAQYNQYQNHNPNHYQYQDYERYPPAAPEYSSRESYERYPHTQYDPRAVPAQYGAPVPYDYNQGPAQEIEDYYSRPAAPYQPKYITQGPSDGQNYQENYQGSSAPPSSSQAPYYPYPPRPQAEQYNRQYNPQYASRAQQPPPSTNGEYAYSHHPSYNQGAPAGNGNGNGNGYYPQEHAPSAPQPQPSASTNHDATYGNAPTHIKTESDNHARPSDPRRRR